MHTLCQWDEYALGIAYAVAMKSKDTTRMGCVILAPDHTPVSFGFNGPPALFPDSEVDWTRPGKYKYMRHAEANALSFARQDTQGCTLYVTGPPCAACALSIVAARIARVVWVEADIKMCDEENRNQAWELLKLGQIQVQQHSMTPYLQLLKNCSLARD